MAGDIQRLFDFGDIVLIHEAAAALHKDILSQQTKQKLELITSKSQHLVPSLSLLWEYFAGVDSTISRLCGCIVVELVKTKVLDGQYAVQQVLNLSKSAKCSSSMLRSLVDLLMILWKTDGSMLPVRISENALVQFYRFHPSMIKEMLACCDRLRDNVGIKAVLTPVLYLILAIDVEAAHKRIFIDWLWDQIENDVVNVTCLWKIYKFASIPDVDLLSYLVKSQRAKNTLNENLAIAVMESVMAGEKDGKVDFGTELRFMEQSIEVLSVESIDTVALSLSSCILRLPYDNWILALKIANQISTRTCPYYSNLFFVSLVNLNAMANQLKTITITTVDFTQLTQLVQSCLVTLDRKSKELDDCFMHKGKITPKTLAGILCHHPETTVPFLRAMQRLAYPLNKSVLNFLASLLVLHGVSDDISRCCCEIIVKMMVSKPEMVSTILPVFIHVGTKKLMVNKAGTGILDFLPQLSVHHVCAPKILRFLLGLVQNERTRERAYHLIGNLYEKQPFIYGQIKYLYEDIISVNEGSLAIMKMELLLVVCRISGADHYDELVPILTEIANKNAAASSDSSAKLLSLAALDPIITWRMLYGKLSKHGSCALSSLCDLAGVIAEISDNVDSDPIETDVFKFLWKLATDRKANNGCRSAALRSLSKFNFNLVKKVESNEKEPTNGDTNLRSLLQAASIFDLFDSIHEENLEDYGLFLSKLISAETEAMGRGIYSNAKLVASKTTSSSLDEVCSLLNSAFNKSEILAMDKNICVSILLTYEPQEHSQRSGDVGKKSLLSEGRHYLHVFQNLLKMVPLDGPLHWKRAVIVPFGWMKFVGRMFSALISSHVSEVELNRVKEKEEGIYAAHLWARDKIVDTLKSVWRENVDARPNCCFALAALAVAVIEYDNNAASNVSSCGSYMDNRQWTFIAMETLFTLAAFNYNPKSRDLLFEDVTQTRNESQITPIINAARLGCSFLLPLLQDNYFGINVHQDFYRLMWRSRSMDTFDDTALFYFWFSISMYVGESTKAGLPFVQAIPNSPSEYEMFGRWITFVIRATAIYDFNTAESLLDSMLRELEDSSRDPAYREATLGFVGLAIISLYSDYRSFDGSTLCHYLDARFNKDSTVTKNDEFPGFLMSFCKRRWKDAYQRSITAALKMLDDQKSSMASMENAFRWLCSCCGSDYFAMELFGYANNFDIDDRTILNDICKSAKRLLKTSTSVKSAADQESIGTCILSISAVAFSTKFIKSGLSESQLPSDYSYLDESSVLRRMVTYLMSGKATKRRVQCILEALVSASKIKPLPPLDWSKVLAALPRETVMDLDVLVVKLALNERSSNLLTKITQPAFLSKLSLDAKMLFFENLHLLVNIVPTGGFRRLLNLVVRSRDDKVIEACLKSSKKCLVECQNLSTATRSTFINWLKEIIPWFNIASYADYRLPIVQRIIDFITDSTVEERKDIIAIIPSSNILQSFAIRISSILAHIHNGISSNTVIDILDTYREVPVIVSPSAIRIITHELAYMSIEAKYRDDFILNLMNAILLNCKRYDGKTGSYEDIALLFDILFASIAAWCRVGESLPPYILDEITPNHALGSDHDRDVVDGLLFADVVLKFGNYICNGNKEISKLAEKVIDWAFLLLLMGEPLAEIHQKFIIGLLQHCRSNEYYVRKIEDTRCLETILQIILH